MKPLRKPFEDVVSEYGATVLRVCRAVVGAQDAEDAWSETFLSALRAYPQLPVDANIEAWLVTIAHRRAIDAVRARSRRPVPAADVADHLAAHYDPAEADSDVWAALGRLPDKQRLAVAYHHIAGLPFARASCWRRTVRTTTPVARGDGRLGHAGRITAPEVARLLDNSPEAARRAAADGIKTLRMIYNRARNKDETP